MLCVFKQDTLSTAYYWYSPGRQEIVRKWLNFFDWDIKHQHKHEIKPISSSDSINVTEEATLTHNPMWLSFMNEYRPS